MTNPGLRFACFEVDDAEKWRGDVKPLPNVIKGEATLFCKLFVDGCSLEGDTWDIFKAHKEEWPSVEDAKSYDAIIVPGARYYATDDTIPFIPKFREVLRQYALNGVKLVGVCFGHQILALALGGSVSKNPSKKFVLKVESIELLPAMHDKFNLPKSKDPTCLRIIESHMDQVSELPPGAVLLGRSPTASHEIALLKENILSMQCHPELTVELTCEKILDFFRSQGIMMTEEELDESHISLTQTPTDGVLLLSVIRDFIHSDPPKTQLHEGGPGSSKGDLKLEQHLEVPTSRTQKVRDELKKMYKSTVDMIDSLPVSTKSTFSSFARSIPFTRAEESESGIEEKGELVSPGLQMIRSALEKNSLRFESKVGDLLELELERGFIQYDRLEVANRLAGAEFQKMAESVKELGERRKEVESRHDALEGDVDQVLDELADVMSQLEGAVENLDMKTIALEKHMKQKSTSGPDQ